MHPISFLERLLLRWALSTAVLMGAVRVVSPGNPRNTVGRGLLVSAAIALVAAPLVHLWWFFLVPFLVGVAAWFALVMGAYDVGPVQAFGVGLVGAAIDTGLDIAIHLLRAAR